MTENDSETTYVDAPISSHGFRAPNQVKAADPDYRPGPPITIIEYVDPNWKENETENPFF